MLGPYSAIPAIRRHLSTASLKPARIHTTSKRGPVLYPSTPVDGLIEANRVAHATQRLASTIRRHLSTASLKPRMRAMFFKAMGKLSVDTCRRPH